jgi:hypothetical protein
MIVSLSGMDTRYVVVYGNEVPVGVSRTATVRVRTAITETMTTIAISQSRILVPRLHPCFSLITTVWVTGCVVGCLESFTIVLFHGKMGGAIIY